MILVLRGGRRYGGDAEEDIRVGLGKSIHNVTAFAAALVPLGRGGGECVLALANLRQPGQPEVHLLCRDGRGGGGKELSRLEIRLE